MSDQIKRYQCRHIFTNGHRCGSPSLRRENFCYYHHTTRKPVQNPQARQSRQNNFDLPLPEDRSAIQLAIGQVLQRIAANQLDPKRAGLLLYGLQIASLNLPREAQNKTRSQEEPTQVEEVIEDPTHGPIAPESELAETKRKSIIRILLENLKDETEQETGCPILSAPYRAKVGESINSTNLNNLAETEPTPEPASTTEHPLHYHTESDALETRTPASTETDDPVPDTSESPNDPATDSAQNHEYSTPYGALTPGVINSTLSAPAACPASITPETTL